MGNLKKNNFFFNILGKRIDDIEKSVTDLMNDLGLSDDEGEK